MTAADIAALLIQPREGTLTRVSEPVRVPIGQRITLCVLAVCSHEGLTAEQLPTLMAVPLSRWVDGSVRPKSCVKCALVRRTFKHQSHVPLSRNRVITPYHRVRGD